MSKTTTAYGSITIVDITDIGEFSVYPMSNSPLSVVYDPNQNKYTPNWGATPLVLKPIVYYAGNSLNVSDTTGLTIEWQRMDGIGSPGDLSDGETKQSDGSLKVSKDKLSVSSTGILTYICTAKYIGPEFPPDGLNATGQITFNLIKHAENVKRCSITGENVFKYNAEGRLINGTVDSANQKAYHVLTATANNVAITQWQYKKSNGEWDSYPLTTGHNNSITAETLKVYAEEDVFINDAATIKIITDDDSVYDIYTIVKLRDGAAGAGTVAAVLSNDDQWIACDSDGNPLQGVYNNAVSTITILEGGKDVTSSWTIDCKPTGATGSYNKDTYTYTVTGITQQSANIEFKCTKDGYTTLYKNFSLTKLIAAKDGVTPTLYSISSDVLATNRTIDGKYTPDKVTFTAYAKTGNADRVPYDGRFKIFTTHSGNESELYESQSNERSKSYTFSSMSLECVRCELYAAGGFSTLLDRQTVVVTIDGATGGKGDKGENGDAAINVVLGNQADIIPCNNDGTVKSDMELNIPFTGYLGTAKEACSVTPSGFPDEIILESNTAGTSSAGGNLKLLVKQGSTLGDKTSGSITLTFTCKGSTIIHYYQWSKSIQPLNGQNAVLFQIYTQNGNIIVNGKNNVTLETSLIDGSNAVNTGIEYKWYKYTTDYEEISGQTESSLVVQPDDVSGYASYKCEAKYNDQTYTAFYAVFDKSDPVQAQVYCSFGTQILNGQGVGAVYTKIFRNGEEIDAIKTETFSTSDPTSAQAGDFYYHLDAKTKTVELMKYSGSKWEAAPAEDRPKATYTYTFRDQNGGVIEGKTVTGKVFYIDGDSIDRKIIIDVEVTV